MISRITAIWILFLLISLNCTAAERYSQSVILMGSAFEISIISDLPKDRAIEKIGLAIEEIRRIENMISSWKENSECYDINQYAGIRPAKVSPEFYSLIERALYISKITEGAFDISFAGCDNLWTFDKKERELPDSSVVKQCLENVDYERIDLNKDSLTVYLLDDGMKISFGAIGKGYAAEKAKQILKKNGIESGVVNASGDICAWGRNEKGESWRIGITNPENASKMIAWLEIDNEAVVTSGNYEKYFTSGGKRFPHIIDPRTGYPASGVKSVSIKAPNAEMADALATAVFVMGVERGLFFVNQLPGVECIIVDSENKLHFSKNITPDYAP